MESLFPSHRIVFSCINNVHVDMDMIDLLALSRIFTFQPNSSFLLPL